MKKFMFFGLITAMFLLGGCGNNDAIDDLTDVTADAEEVTSKEVEDSIDEETLNKAIEVAQTYTENNGKVQMTFNETTRAFDLEYTDVDLKKPITKAVEDLTDGNNIDSLIYLADSLQETFSVIFEGFENQFSIDLIEKDFEEPIFSIKEDEVTYPAIEKANGGSLPEIFHAENRTQIERAVSSNEFLFEPAKAKCSFNFEKEQFEIDITLTPHLDDPETKETLREAAITSNESVKKAHRLDYPTVLTYLGKEVLRIEDGEITNDTWE